MVCSYKKTLKGRKNERQTFRANMGALFSAIIKRLIQNFCEDQLKFL